MIPLSFVSNTISFLDSTYSVYPLWLCPSRMQHEETFVINIGIYGSTKDIIKYNKLDKSIRETIMTKYENIRNANLQ